MYRLDLWKINQYAIKKDHRTEDNIFISNTLYESRVTKDNAKMYLVFVDLSNFYDTINRHVLFYGLFKYGVPGLVYKVIEVCFPLRNKEYGLMIPSRQTFWPRPV